MKSDRGKELSYEQNLERNNTNEVIYKTEIDSDLKKEFVVTRGVGIVRELGADMYTLLHLK